MSIITQSTHEDLVKDGINFIILSYSLFDIFMVMLMGNEIKLSSRDLSYCLFESNWIAQTAVSKKCILIFKERLKNEQTLIVGKIYTLSLPTFTSVSGSSVAFWILSFTNIFV